MVEKSKIAKLDTLLDDSDLDKLEEEIDAGLHGVNPVLNRLIEIQEAKTKRMIVEAGDSLVIPMEKAADLQELELAYKQFVVWWQALRNWAKEERTDVWE